MHTTYGSSLLTISFVLMLGACAGPSGVRGGGCPTVLEQNREQFSEVAQLLVLTPVQQVPWDNYRERVGGLLNDQLKLEPYKGSRRNAVSQIAGQVDALRLQLAAMEELAAAAATLYQSFDERQRKIADQHLANTFPARYSGSICLAGGQGAGPRGERGAPPGGSGR